MEWTGHEGQAYGYLKCLLARVRLGDEQLLDIDAHRGGVLHV